MLGGLLKYLYIFGSPELKKVGLENQTTLNLILTWITPTVYFIGLTSIKIHKIVLKNLGTNPDFGRKIVGLWLLNMD